MISSLIFKKIKHYYLIKKSFLLACEVTVIFMSKILKFKYLQCVWEIDLKN